MFFIFFSSSPLPCMHFRFPPFLELECVPLTSLNPLTNRSLQKPPPFTSSSLGAIFHGKTLLAYFDVFIFL